MPKVFIIAVQTADGFVAKDKSHSPFLWSSKEDKKRFIDITKRAGVVVMGAETFKTFPKPLADRVSGCNREVMRLGAKKIFKGVY